ncbi:MAG: hypothetical protein ABEN55_22090 [Bradymonadaceae bacterium]
MIQDVLESSGLAGFAEIGVIMFVIAFVLVLLRVWWMDAGEARDRAELPLEE